MVLGWNPWSVWNTGPPRFSKNHWHLEKGPRPARLVGPRSVIILGALSPQTTNPLGHLPLVLALPLPALDRPWTCPPSLWGIRQPRGNGMAVRKPESLTSRAPVRWGACHWADTGRRASRSPDDWGGDHRAVGARTSLPQRVGATRMRGNHRSRHVWSCRSLFCWKLWVGFTVTPSFWLRSPWTLGNSDRRAYVLKPKDAHMCTLHWGSRLPQIVLLKTGANLYSHRV